MAKKIVLKQIKINNETFIKILDTFPSIVKKVDDLSIYYGGSKEKNVIYYNDKDLMITNESIVNFVVPIKNYTPWKQVIIRKMSTLDMIVESDCTGTYAWFFMKKILLKHYSEEEIKEIIHSYDKIEYNIHKKQYHNINFDKKPYIQKWENCYKYDINGAHTDALCEIFPKAKSDICFLNHKRKENPNIKCFFNYFVGMFKHKGFSGIYNYIVQRTTEKLLAGINQVGGLLIYANTDGFIVHNPENIMPFSSQLGTFKLEFKGNVYTYRGSNYWVIQCEGDEIVGNVLSEARKYIDLPKGITVNYNKVKHTGGYAAEEIKEVKLCVQ